MRWMIVLTMSSLSLSACAQEASIFEALMPPEGLLPAGCGLSPAPRAMRPPFNSNPAISSDPRWLGLETMLHFYPAEEEEARKPEGTDREGLFEKFLTERGAVFDSGYLASYGQIPTQVYVRALRFKESANHEQRQRFLAMPPMRNTAFDARFLKGNIVILVASNKMRDAPCFEPLRKYFESIE